MTCFKGIFSTIEQNLFTSDYFQCNSGSDVPHINVPAILYTYCVTYFAEFCYYS